MDVAGGKLNLNGLGRSSVEVVWMIESIVLGDFWESILIFDVNVNVMCEIVF